MKRTIRERALAFLLTLVLLFTLVPAAFAAEAGDGEETTPGEGETTPGILTSVAMNFSSPTRIPVAQSVIKRK